MLNYFQY